MARGGAIIAEESRAVAPTWKAGVEDQVPVKARNGDHSGDGGLLLEGCVCVSLSLVAQGTTWESWLCGRMTIL